MNQVFCKKKNLLAQLVFFFAKLYLIRITQSSKDLSELVNSNNTEYLHEHVFESQHLIHSLT